MIDVHYASLTSQGVQHRVFYLDGHPYRYQPRPTGHNFGKQTRTGVFYLVIAVPKAKEDLKAIISHVRAPTFFFTFSSAYMHWPELHALFCNSLINTPPESRRHCY